VYYRAKMFVIGQPTRLAIGRKRVGSVAAVAGTAAFRSFTD